MNALLDYRPRFVRPGNDDLSASPGDTARNWSDVIEGTGLPRAGRTLQSAYSGGEVSPEDAQHLALTTMGLTGLAALGGSLAPRAAGSLSANGRFWTTGEIRKMKELADKGYSPTRIGAEIDRTPDAILGAARYHKIDLPPRRVVPDQDRFAEMWKAGASIGEIEKELGLRPGVGRHLRMRYGLPKRERGPIDPVEYLENGYTHAEVARKLGISGVHLQKIMKDRKAAPTAIGAGLVGMGTEEGNAQMADDMDFVNRVRPGRPLNPPHHRRNNDPPGKLNHYRGATGRARPLSREGQIEDDSEFGIPPEFGGDDYEYPYMRAPITPALPSHRGGVDSDRILTILADEARRAGIQITPNPDEWLPLLADKVPTDTVLEGIDMLRRSGGGNRTPAYPTPPSLPSSPRNPLMDQGTGDSARRNQLLDMIPRR